MEVDAICYTAKDCIDPLTHQPFVIARRMDGEERILSADYRFAFPHIEAYHHWVHCLEPIDHSASFQPLSRRPVTGTQNMAPCLTTILPSLARTIFEGVPSMIDVHDSESLPTILHFFESLTTHLLHQDTFAIADSENFLVALQRPARLMLILWFEHCHHKVDQTMADLLRRKSSRNTNVRYHHAIGTMRHACVIRFTSAVGKASIRPQGVLSQSKHPLMKKTDVLRLLSL